MLAHGVVNVLVGVNVKLKLFEYGEFVNPSSVNVWPPLAPVPPTSPGTKRSTSVPDAGVIAKRVGWKDVVALVTPLAATVSVLVFSATPP
jgi:hypothetical protein